MYIVEKGSVNELYIENLILKVLTNTVLLQYDVFLIVIKSTWGGHLLIHQYAKSEDDFKVAANFK